MNLRIAALIVAANAAVACENGGSGNVGESDAVASGDSVAPSKDTAVPVEASAAYKAARERVLTEVIGTPDHALVAYGLVDPLPAGSQMGVFASGGASDTLAETSYFFWIDDAPGSLYGHETRYVYAGKAITTATHDLWPVRQGKPVFGLDPDEVPANAEIVYKSPPATPSSKPGPALGTASAPLTFSGDDNDCGEGKDPPKEFTVVIAGAGKGHTQMSQNVADMEAALAKVSGANASKDVGAQHFVVDASTDTDARKTLTDHINAINKKMRCCDRLLFYSISHGLRVIPMIKPSDPTTPVALCYLKNQDETGKKDDSTITDECFGLSGKPVAFDKTWGQVTGQPFWGLLIGDTLLSSQSLAKILGGLVTCHITAVVDACYSGGIANDLMTTKNVRLAISSTGANETREFTADGHGTDFSQAMLKGLGDIDAGGAPPDLLWSNAFGAQQTKYDSQAKSDKDHPLVAKNANACECLCPDGWFDCCFTPAAAGLGTLACVDPTYSFCSQFTGSAYKTNCVQQCGKTVKATWDAAQAVSEKCKYMEDQGKACAQSCVK